MSNGRPAKTPAPPQPKRHPGRKETDPHKKEYRESGKDALDPHRTDDVKPTGTRGH